VKYETKCGLIAVGILWGLAGLVALIIVGMHEYGNWVGGAAVFALLTLTVFQAGRGAL
jgi:hypothetical protein